MTQIPERLDQQESGHEVARRYLRVVNAANYNGSGALYVQLGDRVRTPDQLNVPVVPEIAPTPTPEINPAPVMRTEVVQMNASPEVQVDQTAAAQARADIAAALDSGMSEAA